MPTAWKSEDVIAAVWPAIVFHIQRAMDAGDHSDDLVACVSDPHGHDGALDGLAVGVLSRATAREVFGQGDGGTVLLDDADDTGPYIGRGNVA